MPLQIIQQDITKMKVDAIVNAANTELQMGGGVCGAIFKAAGEGALQAACDLLAPIKTGQAAITSAFALPSKYIIHAAGPVYYEYTPKQSEELLRSAYMESMNLAKENGCESIAFPLISSGIYGYPKDEALRVASTAIRDFLDEHELMVYICIFDKESCSFSSRRFNDILAFIGGSRLDACDEKCCATLADEHICLAPTSYQRRAQIEQIADDFCSNSAREKALLDHLKNMDKSFSEKLLDLIDKSGMTDVECYKKANITKQVFHKIKTNKNYKPSKQTAIAFAIALKLDMEGTQDILASAGFTLSRSSIFDEIIRYFIQNEIYDVFEINEALFEFDQVLLGAF